MKVANPSHVTSYPGQPLFGKRATTIWLILCFCLAAASGASAQQFFNTVDTFNGNDGDWLNSPLIQGTNGNLYGTSLGSPSCIDSPLCGAIFQVTPTGTLTTLYEFCQLADCADGAGPTGALVEGANGNFYGETIAGGVGSGQRGTVFEMTPQGVLTTLYSFCSLPNCQDGAFPNGGLLLASDGNFYGVTEYGGPSGSNCGFTKCGTLFQITPGGALTTVADFQIPSYQNPIGPLVQDSSGTFWGVTTQGFGAYYSWALGDPIPGFVAFCQGSQSQCDNTGSDPNPPVLGADGNLYFSLRTGGASATSTCPSTPQTAPGCGLIWNETTQRSVYDFCTTSGCPDGANPTGQFVVNANGNIYGTTAQGGVNTSCPINGPGFVSGCGTAFEITQGSTPSLTTLYNFCSQPNCTDGFLPWGGLMQEPATGNLYGTTQGSSYCPNAGSGCTLFSLSSISGNPTFTPAFLNFGKEGLYETSVSKTVTVTNKGTGNLYLNSYVPSKDFAISGNNCPGALAPKGQCQLTVTFTPNQLGALNGTLTISDSSIYSPQVIQLAGTGITPATLTPTTGSFGKHRVGTTSNAKTFTLKNDQTGLALTGIAISTTGPFTVASTTCGSTLGFGVGGSCTISVTFSPAQTGTATGVLTVTDSSTNSPQISQLTGTGD